MPKRQSLPEIKRLLKSQPHAFYNHPMLLSQIREHGWGYAYEDVTVENTNKNAKYEYCRILHKMTRKREKRIEEGGLLDKHTPARVTFLDTVKSIDDISHRVTAKPITKIKPILKPPKHQENNESIDPLDVYITLPLVYRAPSRFSYTNEEIFQKKTAYK
ncbi:hypothetical protein NEIRO03_0166 [Nematocida sp. AWRm78]|nr:hypothetical protein NEIRO02_0020 [Nematocida sp. AWRm79]KAI5182482.1 hypothetical protein NEIRO03_0166 [Nematocida sp. AWRm78]